MVECLVEERVDVELCLLVLSNQGFLGLVYLVDLAGRELP